jgi:GNAT superfamily N-acetyltransferase
VNIPSTAAPPQSATFQSVTSLSREETAEILDLLAGSFEESPLFVDAFKVAGKRRRAARALLAAVAQDGLRFGRVRVARDDGIKAILIWYPPGCYRLTLKRRLRLLPHYARMALAGPAGYWKIYRAFKCISAKHPTEPHLYASYLGVAPDSLRSGVGRVLSEFLIEEAYRTAMPLYFETQLPKNVRWYVMHGGHVLHHGTEMYPGGPPYWTVFGRPYA